MTADIDVTVELGTRSVTMLLEVLTASGFTPAFEFDETFVAGTRRAAFTTSAIPLTRSDALEC